MKDYLIENYRGFEVYLDSQKDCFISLNDIENKSFRGIKKIIDDYIKGNDTFKVFEVEKLPSSYSDNEKFKVVEISHKTRKFQIENNKGEKSFVSEYNERDYILVNENNEIVKKEYYKLRKQEKELNKKIAEVTGKFKKICLKDVKNNYIVEQ